MEKKETKMAILENITDEELEELAGGTIVQVDTSMGTYYVVVDERHKGRIIRTGTTLEAAEYFADQSGVSKEIITKEDFKNKYHYDLPA